VIGQTLAQYRVVAAIGAGGMGEVFRARDTRLDREVAIKVLPAAFAADAERLARFEREAKLLASLNHSNIAHVYGFESASLPDGSSVHFLAMELVEGEDLAERLKRGAIPADEALAIAKQIAEALEEAHDNGIVHRDLKPANVKVTPGGKVKVLDFGLAKAYAGDSVSGSSSDLSRSPTLAHSGTQAGVILGTAAYMSPEQARGKTVDKRADIWAFGVVLYEMLSGRRLFDGETVSDVLAAVLKTEPDWSELPAATPAAIRQLLRRCLERNPRNRLHDMADARIVIDEALAGGQEEGAGAVVEAATSAGRTRTVGWSLGVAGALALGLVAGWLLGGRGAQRESELRFPLALPVGWKLADVDTPVIAISRDGRRRAVAAVDKDGREALLVAETGDVEWKELPGTLAARAPFFSPDGAWIGYFGDGGLQRVAVAGGPPVVVVATGSQIRGAVWLADGSIVYSPDADTPLLRIREGGGEPQKLTTLQKDLRERTHRWPDALPDGSAVLFTSDSAETTEFYDDAVIEAVAVATGERKIVLRGSSQARYLDPGVLVFARGGSLFATQFDPRSLEVRGLPVPVLEGVATTVASGTVQFALSHAGDLLWVPGDASGSTGGRPVWIGRDGARSAPLVSEGTYTQLDIAPDGRRLALVASEGGRTDAWIVDLETGARSRLTFDGDVSDPTWTPDGKRLTYARAAAAAGGNSDLYWKLADGSGSAEPLVGGPETVFAASLSPDGRSLIYDLVGPESLGNDLWILPLDGERQPRAFLATPAPEFGARISPDGRFVAYVASDTGRNDVFVRPFPAGAGLWQISNRGGVEPNWSRDGRELYFRDRGTLYRVAIDPRGSFSAGSPERVAVGFRPGENSRTYSPAADGSRFVALPGWEVSIEAGQVNLALDWKRDVRRRLSLEP
jgi:hypothetical protein